jgi:hypothetical protein
MPDLWDVHAGTGIPHTGPDHMGCLDKQTGTSYMSTVRFCKITIINHKFKEVAKK